jgi:hypothetical protein
MTILAPLKTLRCQTAATPAPLKGFAALIVALAVSGCASTATPPVAQDISANVAALGAEAAAIAGDSATPSVRTLGMSVDRKRALRQLAVRSIRSDNPGSYTVVKGDTLWDISERFLSRPWLWPEIWQVNPQIENPHLIYPGDRVSLTYVDGQPKLQLIRAASRSGTPIDTYKGLRSFLVKPKIVSSSALKRAPYVVGTEDDRLVASVGNHIYARGGDLTDSRYSVYRPGKALVDPDTNSVIGHEAILVSQASVIKSGDPAKLVITSNKRETLVGDRLMASEPAVEMNFQPRTADSGKRGKVISLFDALARVGQNQVVVINLGAEDGVQPGDLLSVYGNDRRISDPFSGRKNDSVVIEGDKSGVLMVFRAFDKASYALVVQSETTINMLDRVGDI